MTPRQPAGYLQGYSLETLLVKTLILNEEELIKRCVNKDRHAQEFLFNQYYKELYTIGMRYMSDHHDTEDVVILTFTKVFKMLTRFEYRGTGSLGRWIRTILINESINLLKKRKLIQFQEDVISLEISHDAPDSLSQLQASDIYRMIERLPTGYRTVFNLFVVEGYSHKEIADMLGVSEGTSKSQLKKARTHLMNNVKQGEAYGTL